MALVTAIVTLLILAALFLVLGTLRGSFRFWLLGYALVVAGLVVLYARIHAERIPPPAVQEAPWNGGTS